MSHPARRPEGSGGADGASRGGGPGRQPRFRRLLALATASGVTVVAAVASAGAAGAATTPNGGDTLYRGTADASAVQLVLTLPDQLTAATGAVLPNPADLSLIRTTGQALHDGKSPDVATSTADLAGGNVVTASALAPALTALNQNVTATLANPRPAAFSGGTIDPASNPLRLGFALGPLTAGTNPTDRSTDSAGALVRTTAGSLADLLPAPALQGLDSLIAEINTALTSATAALAPVTSAVGGLAPPPGLPPISVPNPLASVVPGTPSTITVPTTGINGGAVADAVNQLPAQVAALIARLRNGALVTVNGVTTSQSVKPGGTATVSSGAANVGDVSLFGGLVSLVATKATATASAGAAAGKAAANASATLVEIRVSNDLGDLLKLVASEQGVTADLLSGTALGSALNAATKDALTTVNASLNALLAELTSLLQMLGSSAKIIQQGTVTKSTSPDGRHAEAHATPAQVAVGLPVAPNLVALSLGKVDVVADRQVVPPVAVAPAGVTRPTVPERKLAFTGASLPLTAGLAAGLLAVAAALARRRREPGEAVTA